MTGNDGDVPRTVHDALFKQLFSDPALAAQELRAVLPPALVAIVDWAVMTHQPGARKGQRAMLLRRLGRRFGAVPEPVAARVSAATLPELERWSDRVLDAASLDDVFGGE